MAVLEITNYATLVQKASIVEAGSEQNQKNKELRKRKFECKVKSSAGGNFLSKFVRATVSQPAKSTGFKRTEGNVTGQSGR